MIVRTLFFCCALALTGFAQKQPPPQAAPLDRIQAEKEGRALVAKILSQEPAENFTNTGVMKIRDAKGKRIEIPAKFEIIVTPTNWQSIYATVLTNNAGFAYDNYLQIFHVAGQPNKYNLYSPDRPHVSSHFGDGITWYGSDSDWALREVFGDFWPFDLGLEFFHWPVQRLLKTEMIRSRSCRVLESINPQPAPGAYSRVRSWIDIESNGILHAEAYDSKGKILKEFDPNVKKVNAQWQLSEMEMINRQTGSRTQIEFNQDAQ